MATGQNISFASIYVESLAHCLVTCMMRIIHDAYYLCFVIVLVILVAV